MIFLNTFRLKITFFCSICKIYDSEIRLHKFFFSVQKLNNSDTQKYKSLFKHQVDQPRLTWNLKWVVLSTVMHKCAQSSSQDSHLLDSSPVDKGGRSRWSTNGGDGWERAGAAGAAGGGAAGWGGVWVWWCRVGYSFTYHTGGQRHCSQGCKKQI